MGGFLGGHDTGLFLAERERTRLGQSADGGSQSQSLEKELHLEPRVGGLRGNLSHKGSKNRIPLNGSRKRRRRRSCNAGRRPGTGLERVEARGIGNQNKAARPGRACSDITTQRRRPLQPEWRLPASQGLGPREGVEQAILYTYGVQPRGNDEGGPRGPGRRWPPLPCRRAASPCARVVGGGVGTKQQCRVRRSRAGIARMAAVVTRPWLGWEWRTEGPIR